MSTYLFHIVERESVFKLFIFPYIEKQKIIYQSDEWLITKLTELTVIMCRIHCDSNWFNKKKVSLSQWALFNILLLATNMGKITIYYLFVARSGILPFMYLIVHFSPGSLENRAFTYHMSSSPSLWSISSMWFVFLFQIDQKEGAFSNTWDNIWPLSPMVVANKRMLNNAH